MHKHNTKQQFHCFRQDKRYICACTQSAPRKSTTTAPCLNSQNLSHEPKDTSFGAFLVHDAVATLTAPNGIACLDLIL